LDIDRWCQGIGVVILGLLYALQGSTAGAILIAPGKPLSGGVTSSCPSAGSWDDSLRRPFCMPTPSI